MQVPMSWEERFINWDTNHSEWVRFKRGKAAAGMDCIDYDVALFKDLSQFFDMLRREVREDRQELQTQIDNFEFERSTNASWPSA